MMKNEKEQAAKWMRTVVMSVELHHPDYPINLGTKMKRFIKLAWFMTFGS